MLRARKEVLLEQQGVVWPRRRAVGRTGGVRLGHQLVLMMLGSANEG